MAEKYGTIPKDFKGRLAYFWDYYKWHTIAVCAVLVVLAVTLTQCINRVDPDYSILLSINKTVLSDYVDKLEQNLVEYGVDVNGDGQVSVEIIDVSVSSSEPNPQMVTAQRTKMMAELQLGNVMIFITDENQFTYLDDQVSAFQTSDFLPDQGGKAFNWKGTALAKKVNDGYFPDELFFSLRAVDGTALQKDEKAVKREKAAKTFLQNLIQKNPVSK